MVIPRICPLTTNADNTVGTTGNDTINANYTAASGMTFQGTDSIDGGAGTDTLYIQVGGAGTYTAASLKNVETVSANFSAGGTINLLGSTGVTTVAADGSTNAGIFSNIGSTTVALKDSNDAGGVTFGFTAAAVAGSADSATLTLSNVTGGTEVIAGIETLNIVSSGGPNTVAAFTTANATKYVVTGDQNLTITAGLGTTVTEVDANAFTGGLTATMGAVAAATVTGGAGNDALTVTAVTGDVVVNAGAGNDTITDVTNLTTTDSIDGGDGTDTLSTTAAIAEGYTAPTTATITNIEALNLTTAGSSGVTLTTSNFGAGVNTVTLALGTAGAYGVTGPASALTVNVKGAALGGALTLTDTGTAITDAATLANTHTAGGLNIFAAQNITSTGYETLTIKTGTSSTNTTAETLGTITVNPDSGGTSTVKFSGNNNISTGIITAGTIDASGMTGTGTFTNVGATVGATKITGSGNDDTIVGSATATSIDGGAGIDDITGGAGNDTIVGGAGNDSITVGAGVDTVNGGDGDDTITFSATADFVSTDTVDGGAGTDTMVTTIDAQTALTATLTNVSNIEKLRISDALAGATLNMARYGATGPTTVVLAGAASGGATISNLLNNSTIEQRAANAGVTLTASLATDGATDALTLKLNSATGVDFGTVTAATHETFTINSTTTGAAPSTYTNTLVLGTTNGTGATVTGNVALALSTSTAAVSIATIDASGMTGGGISADNTNATVVSTLTGSGYADTLIGGSAADTITGGDGNDSLSGGSGADSMVGGTGDDTLNGGAGSDVIQGGDGADTIYTSGGADNIDGGAGTDILLISASFGNISGHTLTSVETLNMNSTATTMSVAQFAGFTTISNIAGVTFSDAGTIAGNTNLTSYTLANGTNAFTASTTALNVSVVGGTGADTFNFGSAAFDVNDTITGGTGTDTLNLTGNTAMTVTLTNVATVENIVLSNTSTAVSLTLVDGNVAGAGTLTIDGSSLTTAAGILTVVGGGEQDGSLNIIGGNAADILTGGDIADTITGGAGADTIANQAAATGTASKADKLSGGTGADTFILRGDVASGLPATIYATAANVSDFSISGTNGIDVLQLSGTFGNYSGATGYWAGVAAAAAGATGVLDVAVDAGVAALTAGTDIIHFTTATTALATLQLMFDAVIGTGTLTGLGASTDVFFSLYDSTNSKMVIGLVDAGSAGTNTIVETADAVTLIGTMDMTSVQYAAFTNANFSIIAA